MRRWVGFALLLVVASCSGGGNKVTTAMSSSSSTTTTSTSTSTTTATSTTLAAVAATAPSTTTTTIDLCRNSVDPACGELVWDPPLLNRPLTITITADKTEVHAGETVTFTATVSDPDAPPRVECLNWAEQREANGPGFYFFREHPGVTTCYGEDGQLCPDTPVRYGRWAPPPGEGGGTNAGSTTMIFDRAPTAPTPMTIRASTYSGRTHCGPGDAIGRNPADDGLYASNGEGFITIMWMP